MITVPLELQSEKALRAVMNAVDRLARLWHLDDRQLAVILGLDEATVTAVRNGAPVAPTADLAERISYLLGIKRRFARSFRRTSVLRAGCMRKTMHRSSTARQR
jgi:plasmid maintenance system antidote protein VapI